MMPGFSILLTITLVVMIIGLVGSVLPGLPGVPLIFLAALVYSYLTDFSVVGALILVLLGLFALLALAADFVGTAYGARRFGASPWGTAGGAIGGLFGALVGALFFGIGAIAGLILGSIGGVFAGEYLRRRRREPESSSDWRGSSRAAGGVLVGYAISAVAQGTLGIISVAIFVAAVIY
jgi:uncharacterized protein YqgC (DUF456 family)